MTTILGNLTREFSARLRRANRHDPRARVGGQRRGRAAERAHVRDRRILPPRGAPAAAGRPRRRCGAPWALCRRDRARPADAGDPGGRGGELRTPSGGRSGRRPSTPARRSPCGCSTPIRRRRSARTGSRRGCARALALRETLFDAPFYRLVHAEADGLPGVVIDRFGDAAVVQPNAAWAEARLAALVEALQAVTGVATVVKNAGGRARALEGLDDASAVRRGRARRAGGGADERRGLFRRPRRGAEDRASSTTSGRTTPSRRGWRAGGACSTSSPTSAASRSRRWRRGRRRRSRSTARRRRWSWRRGARRRAASPSASRRGEADAFDAMAALAGGGAALRRRGLRPAGLRAEQGGARGRAARLRAGGAARRRRWSSRTASSSSARAAMPPISRASARRACAAWPRPGGRRRSSTSAGPGPDHPVHPGAGGDRLSQGALPAARPREGAARRLRAVSDR